MAENIEIPRNTDKMIFAEDIVHFIMRQMNGRPYKRSLEYEKYHGFVSSAFNDCVQTAVFYLDRTLEMADEDIVHFMNNENLITRDDYVTFAQSLIERYLPNGFDVDLFLEFCVNLVKVAVFFSNNGVHNAPEIAVQYISNVCSEYDTNADGWDKLHKIAAQYAAEEALFSDLVFRSKSTVEIQNPVNSPEEEVTVVYEKKKSGDEVVVVKECGQKVENIFSPSKRLPSETEQTTVSKKPRKIDPEWEIISKSSEPLPSTSSVADSEKFNDPCCSKEPKSEDKLGSTSSDVKSEPQSGSSNVQDTLAQTEHTYSKNPEMAPNYNEDTETSTDLSSGGSI